MLVDGRIRNQLVSLADTVGDPRVDSALRDVRRAASVRAHRRRTRTGAGVMAVAALAGAVWVAPRAPVEEAPPPKPIRRPDPSVERVREAVPERDTAKRLWTPPGRGSTGASSGEVLPSGDKKPRSGADDTVPSSWVRRRPEVRSGAAPLEPSSVRTPTRRETAAYEPAAIPVRADPRSGCTFDGQSCPSFETQVGDVSAEVTVEDRLGEPVPIRVTQWDRYGSSIVEPIVVCGATGSFDIHPDADNVTVSVEEGTCEGGREVSPKGGRVHIVFRGER